MKRIYFLFALFSLFWQINAQTYCTPAFASGCADGDQIDGFSIPSASFDHPTTGCSAGAYGDFTSMTITLQPTISYGFTVTHGYSSQNVKIWVDFNNDGTFDEATETVGSGSSGSTMTTNGTIIIPSGTAVGNYRMRVADRWNSQPIPCNIDGYGEAHDYTVAVTAPPSCIAPTNLAVSNVTTATADVTWTASSSAPANGYDVYYSTSNTAPNATTTPNHASVAATTQMLSGLSPATTYYVWVRSACSSSSFSLWTSSATFTTVCVAADVPYYQDFNSATTPAMPTCTLATNAGSANNWVTANNPGYGFTDNTLVYYYNWQNAANAWFFTQGINLVAGTTYRIKYRYGNNSATYIEKMKVTYGTAQDAASQTNVLHDYTSITNVLTPVSDFYTLTPTTSGVYYFGFNVYSDSNQYNLYLDDIIVEVNPTCVEPTGLAVSAITPFTANISWTAPTPAPASGYEYYYSTSNTAPTATTTPNGTTTNATVDLTNLLPSTMYYFWVRSVCSATDSSPWSSSVSFTTQTFCPTVTAPANNVADVSLTPTITWDAMSGAAGYTITVGTTSGGTDVLNNFDVGNVTSYTFTTPLLNSTSYFYTVNAYVGGVTSNSCTERKFFTVCAPVTPTYNNDFATYPGACWSNASGGNDTTGPSGTTQYWYGDGFLNSGTSGAAKINLYSTNRTGWLVSPVFDLSSGTYTLTLDYGVTAWNDTIESLMGSDDVVQVLMSTDGGTTWTVIQSWDAGAPVSNASNAFSYPITTTSNNVKFAIYGSDGTVDDLEDYDFFIDNFVITPTMGTSDLANTENVKVYPNPFKDIVNITDVREIKSVSVIDMSGRLVKTVTNPNAQINLGDLQAGVYILKLDYKDGSTKSVKAIKK